MAKRNSSNRPRSSRNAKEGYHRFTSEETGDEHGSFKVYYIGRGDIDRSGADASVIAEDRGFDRAGWYWHAEFPGCMPDGSPMGPFTSSLAAFRDAQDGA